MRCAKGKHRQEETDSNTAPGLQKAILSEGYTSSPITGCCYISWRGWAEPTPEATGPSPVLPNISSAVFLHSNGRRKVLHGEIFQVSVGFIAADAARFTVTMLCTALLWSRRSPEKSCRLISALPCPTESSAQQEKSKHFRRGGMNNLALQGELLLDLCPGSVLHFPLLRVPKR